MSDTEQIQLDPYTEPVRRNELRGWLDQLYQKGVIDDSDYERIKSAINSDRITTKKDLSDSVHKTVSEIHDRNPFSSNRNRREAHALAEETLQSLDLPTAGMDWRGTESMSTKIINGPLRFMGELVTGGMMETRDKETQTRNSEHKRQFLKELLSSKLITNSQYNELVKMGVLDEGKSLLEVIDHLSDEIGLTDADIEASLGTSTTAVFRRKNREMEAAEQRTVIREESERLIGDDEARKRRREFETLDEQKPGKYMWNSTNSMIYEKGTGQLVDGDGAPIQYNESGELPTGILPNDTWWTAAQEQEPPWMEYGVDEETYFDLLDVVENPEQFHQGGIGRFASGGQFIGGFASDYGVAQDEITQKRQHHKRYGGNFVEAMEGTGYGDYLSSKVQSVRRPWYDPGDNWALYAGRSPEDVAVQQQHLVDIGALDASDVVFGMWGQAEAETIERMMTIANGQAVRLEDIGDDFWQNFWSDQADSGVKRAQFAAPSYRKLDPARMELTIQDTIRRALGRDPSQDELAELGTHMADMHRQSFAADVEAMKAEFDASVLAQDQQKATAAGEVEEVDWEARFMQTFQQTHGAELARFDRTEQASQRQQVVGGALSNFMGQLGGGIGQ